MTDDHWWTFRPAQNLSGSTYSCPFCDEPLLALTEHMLVLPEADPSRRRHAHIECVREARSSGQLRTEVEWRATQPPRRSVWARALERIRGRWPGPPT